MELILPFCRSNLKDFNYKIFSSIENPDKIIVFNFNGPKVKIDEKINSQNCLIFGKYKEKFVAISEDKENSGEFHHIMGSYFSKYEDLRTLAGIAYALKNWNDETKFCGNCGNYLTFSKKENIAKICNNCKKIFYPRLNPAIIAAVRKNNKILITRKAEWKGDRVGLIAGFIEYGESIEETAIREIYEETGIIVKNVKYIASQFWPFPYQLMIGLSAEYKEGEINIDKNEISEAKWMKINEISEDILPPPSSIARFLFENLIKTP